VRKPRHGFLTTRTAACHFYPKSYARYPLG
jgi:hypothetical protein